MLDAKFDFYTIIDEGATNWKKFLKRSRLIYELNVKSKKITVYSFRIPGFWRGIFFIGPKQAVRLSKNLLEKIDTKILRHVELALNNVEPELRQYLSDETVLGTILYYSGIKWIPWLEYSVHYTHGSIKESNNLRKNCLSP